MVTRHIEEDAEAEAKLAFLIDEARRTQERLNALEQKVEEEHVRLTNRLNDLRREFYEAIGSNIETSKARFLFLRRIGLAFLWDRVRAWRSGGSRRPAIPVWSAVACAALFAGVMAPWTRPRP